MYRNYNSQMIDDEDLNSKLLYHELTEQIIAHFYTVYNTLGYGFLEKVYENALSHELTSHGFNVQKQYPIKVYYHGIHVGEYFADMVVDSKIIIELKASTSLVSDHILQLQNYLRGTDFEVGLLFNFGKKPEIRRKQYLNVDKPNFKISDPDDPDHPLHPLHP